MESLITNYDSEVLRARQTVQGVAWFSENEGTKIAQCYFKHTDSPSRITKCCSDNTSKRGDRDTNTQKDENKAWKHQHVPEAPLIHLFIQLVSSQGELGSPSAKARVEIYPGRPTQ